MGRVSDTKIIHFLKWSEVSKAKRNGGLGNLEGKNWALLAK